MTTRRVGVLAVTLVCLTGAVLAQDEEPRLSNWSAPPYWNPMVQPRVEGGTGGMPAQALGMQAHTEALPSSPLPFVAIAPCRVVDTRVPVSDGFHQPNFANDEARTFNLPASPDCTGLPATAGAWSLNIQFRPISQLSYLTAYPTGTTMPGVSTLTAGPAAWVQNAAIVPAGTGGAIDIYCQYAGRVVIDINGYYGPQSVVTSLNARIGDVTLAPGSNIAITPSGNTLTIAMTGVPGGTLPAGAANQTLRSDGVGWLASSALTNDGSNVGVSGNLTMPNSSATAGQIMLGNVRFIHDYGTYNVFLGKYAGNFALTGNNNTGIGFEALYSNTAGFDNSGVGAWSLGANTIGCWNTAIGHESLRNNSSADANTAVGAGALATQSFSNSNSRYSSHNTAVGFHALHANEPTAASNGTFNTAVGSYALTENTTGSVNTAIGYNSLSDSTTGYSNTAAGAYSLSSNTLGWQNTAAGHLSMYSNTGGYDNTASGEGSMYSNSTGYRNVASGYSSLWSNTEGSYNTASGSESLRANTTGSSNTAFGYQSLYAATANTNIAVGYRAGYYLTTGTYNIDIGNMGDDADYWTIRIGDANQSRTFISGIRGVTTDLSNAIPVLIDAAGQLGTASSSIRVKRDVAAMGDATDRLLQLRPVTFRYRAHPDGPRHFGLVAEEVDEVMPELVVRDTTGRPETVAYHELPAMLLNEMQKQHRELTEQRATIAAQQAQIEELRRQVETLLQARQTTRR